MIKDNGLGRYHIHAHEFRDLFKSLCTLSGVSPIASEFFLGHTIDKLGYDKSSRYDEDWFRREYMKVEPYLNLISNPHGDLNRRMDRLKSEILLEAVRSFAKALGIDPMKIRMEKKRKLKREPTSEEEIQLLQEEVKKLRANRSGNDCKPYQSKIIGEDELVQYVEDGWEIVRELRSGRFLVKKPNHHNLI